MGRDVFLPSRYRPALEERPELAPYRSAVQFIDDEGTLLTTSELAVLARRPTDNEALARRMIARGCPSQLVIEKPIAPTPSGALSLERDLKTAGVRYATPYLFAYCDWARDCQSEVAAGRVAEVKLDWHFRSKQPPDSWKSTSREGGGVLSYYFIHVIALGEFLLGDYRVLECQYLHEGQGHGLRMVAASGAVRFHRGLQRGPGRLAVRSRSRWCACCYCRYTLRRGTPAGIRDPGSTH